MCIYLRCTSILTAAICKKLYCQLFLDCDVFQNNGTGRIECTASLNGFINDVFIAGLISVKGSGRIPAAHYHGNTG